MSSIKIGRSLLKQRDMTAEEKEVYQTFLDEWSPRVGSPLGEAIAAGIRSGRIDASSTAALRRSVSAEIGDREGAIQTVMREVGEDGMVAGRAVAGRQFGIDVAYEDVPVAALDELDDWAVTASQHVSNTIEDEVTNYLERAHEGGLDVEEIADQFQSEYVDMRLNESHAEQLARDTTVGPANQGRHTAIEESSAIGEEWVASLDGRERDAHAEADGQIVPVGSTFLVGGEELRHPHDPQGSIGNTTNCRCRLIAVFEDDLTESEVSTILDGERLNA